jgi:hypothetical protein
MFQLNKYTTTYYNIIYRAQARATDATSYTENHHIIPKSLGGLDIPSNLVKLTAREHFVCHLLLVKMLTGNAKHKMAFALSRMLTSNKNHNRYMPSSRLYEFARKHRSAAISYSHKGISESIESNIKRSIAQKGVPKGPKTPEHKLKLSLSKKGKPSKNKGGTTCLKGLTYEEIHGVEKATQLKQDKSIKLKNRQFSDETKKLWSDNRKGKHTGENNSNASPVMIDGVLYGSKKEACQNLGISLFKLNQLI